MRLLWWRKRNDAAKPAFVAPADSAHIAPWVPPFRDPVLRRQLGFSRHLLRYGLRVAAINLALGGLIWAALLGVGALRESARYRLYEQISDFGRPPMLLLGVEPAAADRVRAAIDKEFEFGSPYSSEYVDEFQATVKGEPSAQAFSGRYRNLWTLLDHVNYEGNERIERAALTFLSARLTPDHLSLNHYGLQSYLWSNYLIYIDDHMASGRFTAARTLAAQAVAHFRQLDTTPSVVHDEVQADIEPWFRARQNLILLLDALFSESAAMYLDPGAALRLYHGVLELYPFAHQALLQRRLERTTLQLLRREDPGLLVFRATIDSYGAEAPYDLQPEAIEERAREQIQRLRRSALTRLAAAADVRPAVYGLNPACTVERVAAQFTESGAIFSSGLRQAVAALEAELRQHGAVHAADCAGQSETQGQAGSDVEPDAFEVQLDSAVLQDERVLARFLAIEEPRLRRFGELLVGIVRLRARQFDAARALFQRAAASPNPRIRDVALLDQARAIFWAGHAELAQDDLSAATRRERAHSAIAQIRALSTRIGERNFATDLAYYVGELQALAKGPPAAVERDADED